MCFGPNIKEIKQDNVQPEASAVADTAVAAESATPQQEKKKVGRSTLTIDIRPTQSGGGLNLPV